MGSPVDVGERGDSSSSPPCIAHFLQDKYTFFLDFLAYRTNGHPDNENTQKLHFILKLCSSLDVGLIQSKNV